MQKEYSNVDFIREHYPDSTLAVGFDKAIVGYDASSGTVIYHYDVCVSILEQKGMEKDEALEHMEYNVVGSKYGDLTPIFMHTLPFEMKHEHGRARKT